MYVNEEDVPLIAPTRPAALSNGLRVWKFITATVAISALGLVVVSLNGGFATKSTSNVSLSEKKMKMVEAGTLKYNELSDGEKSSLFTNFQSTFARQYPNTGEEETRFKHFKKFLSDVDERNALERAKGGTAVHGVTIFSDLSDEEFKSQYLGYKPSDNKRDDSDKVSVPPYLGSTTSVDWSGTLTTAVKDQGYCGSCWAFSTTEQIESDSILAGLISTSTALSTQQIVSCDTTTNGVSSTYANWGCDGGFTETAYEYVMSAGGITTEALYPYTSYYATTGTCSTSKDDYLVTVTSYNVLDSEDSMESHVLSTGPLSVCLDASLWSSYTSGIVSSCGDDIDHCVQVVGLNLDEGYWIIRNSWGTSWGLSGYLHLESGSDMCGITYSPTYTEVSAA